MFYGALVADLQLRCQVELTAIDIGMPFAILQ